MALRAPYWGQADEGVSVKRLVVSSLLTALLCGCYSTREVVVTEEEGLPPDPEIRQVTTAGGERFEFTKFQGRYGILEDTLVTGVTEHRGPVRIPVSQIRQAMVSELNVFATVLGVARRRCRRLVVGLILDSSGGSAGSSGGSSGGGGG